MNTEEEYGKEKAEEYPVYYIAEALVEKGLGNQGNEETGVKAYEIREIYVGKDLEYKEYEPLFDYANEVIAKQKTKSHFVTCYTYVTLTDGTGVVHISPAFGEDDAKVGRKYDLPFVQPVDGIGESPEDTSCDGGCGKEAE